MDIIEFEFSSMPESFQFCTDTVIFAYHDAGFMEFQAYCMINSQARPMGIEIEETGENRFLCHVLTSCGMIAMSEKCILLKGKLKCKEVNQQMHMTVRQRIIEGL